MTDRASREAAYAAEAEAVEAVCAKRFARWDATAWRRHRDGPFLRFARMGASPEARRAYLTLSAEALGQGHLDRDGLLRWLVLDLLPRHARSTTPGAMAQAWNVAESFLGLAPWLHRRAAAAITSPGAMAAQVAEVLGTALGEVAPARFAGPYTLSTHDTESDTFLPGHLHFVAPRILCVHDRLRRGAHVAWELGPSPRNLGPGDCLGPSLVATTPTLRVVSSTELRVGDLAVLLPRVKLHGAPAVSPAGLVAFAVVDSQRVWVAASP